jgi:hypothetical protein
MDVVQGHTAHFALLRLCVPQSHRFYMVKVIVTSKPLSHHHMHFYYLLVDVLFPPLSGLEFILVTSVENGPKLTISGVVHSPVSICRSCHSDLRCHVVFIAH